jgi:carboxyl-terminal processing protease
VIRFGAGGSYEMIPFSIQRAPFTSESVKGRILESDPNIGILKISQFDLTTPTQFKKEMDSLIEKGCTKFVFDVRYNPGGALLSIEAVLSTLLNEGDIMISTVYKSGAREEDYVRVADYSIYAGYEGCSVTAEDIGKYRGYEFAVLVNEYTASAAELFTANLRDYELATIVGVTTYGKGCMQTTFDLEHFGVEGALKLTTAWYQPPCGENYHDVGISPDLEVELDEALIDEYGNVYLIPDDRDPQMLAAIQALK